MNRQFQNRLVGTIVLVALGVIFLPDLLDGKKTQVVEEFTEIPLRPLAKSHNSSQTNTQADEAVEEFQVLTIAEPQELGSDVVELGDDAPSEVVKADTKPVQAAPVKTVVKTEPKAEPKKEPAKVVAQVKAPVKTAITAGFTLQLGGFNNASNVNTLVAQLRKAGFTTYTLPAKPIDGRLTRVFVGPEVSEAKLKARQDPIFKLTGLKGKIIAYNPQEQ
ncbi:cell division protein DedD [Shewanella inventionis]|uniref:Cell division protein DedD n=1 Tax=Shewanella inventionis TaxID=1738770 RepID=A0ABQ1JT31_9GAMM|nr:cell division protein DedD [Shewanella inventionis]MCL1160019.1 cell division protein DedD [Shewanella inventionis]GGB76614.1 cell division protein DedD [Shewanella inventionis]